MNSRRIFQNIAASILAAAFAVTVAAAERKDFSPRPDEQQLPRAMHSAMKDRPRITVGLRDADIMGFDNRALQAAVDYIASLGGGTVEIGEGEYLMRDSLHLRSHVVVRGVAGKTVLKKAKSIASPLGLDGDFGEEQVTLAQPDGFEVGNGIAVWDKNAGGFHTTVGRITGRSGNRVSFTAPLMADCMVGNGARAATVFPVVSGYDLEEVTVENLVIEGNKSENINLNGCRGAGIFLYRGFGTVIHNCVVRNYNGDGISFQQSNDVLVNGCTSEGNAGLGIHPGSGSQRPRVMASVARDNGEDGLYLCWRVRHGVFENNVFENNGRYGISIGHKDSDNLLQNNRVLSNNEDGVHFRNESLGMAGHRNRLENNIIENNGRKGDAVGIRIRGEVQDLIFKNNTIRDTRPQGEQRQRVGIRIEPDAGPIQLLGNTIQASTQIEDKRKDKEKSAVNSSDAR